MPASLTLQHSSDHDLIQYCLDGNQSAWEELVERYARLVYSIPLRWGLTREDANDVFQNVFTIVLRQLERLRDRMTLLEWLITIAYRET